MFEIHERPRGFFIFGERLFEKTEQVSVEIYFYLVNYTQIALNNYLTLFRF